MKTDQKFETKQKFTIKNFGKSLKQKIKFFCTFVKKCEKMKINLGTKYFVKILSKTFKQNNEKTLKRYIEKF